MQASASCVVLDERLGSRELPNRLTLDRRLTLVCLIQREAMRCVQDGSRDPDAEEETPAIVQESRRSARQRGAYAAAIAAKSSWRSRLDSPAARRNVHLAV